MKKSILFLFYLIFLFLFASGQHLEKTIDSLVSSQIKITDPGCALLVAKNRQIVYYKAFGSANLELKVPLQPAMVFRIGSVTKQFTAVGILQLVEQDKISLQDSVQQYIKDFPSKGYPITIENLLTHTSGLIDYTSIDDPDPYIERRDFTPEFIINYFKHEPLQFKPGTKYSYSNSNYVLLAYIISKVSGESYHKYMHQNVLQPAGLDHTYYADESTIIPGRVEGYTKDKGFYQNTAYQTISLGFGCGDLLSTVGDLYKWNNALLTGKLIKKEILEKAFTPYKLRDGTTTNYGYGWFIDTIDGAKCIHHEGQVSGFIAEEKYFPDKSTYAVILTNVKSGEDKTDFSSKRFQLFDNIFSLAVGNKLSKGIAVSDEILNSYAGTYQVDSLFKKDGIGKTKVNTGEKIIITKKDNELLATLSNNTGKNMHLLPQTKELFLLPDVARIRTTIEFIIEDGKPIGLYWTQEHKSEWKKIP